MASNSEKHGACPVPFMQESLFPSKGGYVPGRFCDSIKTSNGNTSCCLPCPQPDWRYSEGFVKKTEIANWFATAVFIANCLILISYAVLPVKATHRHYLNVCLIVAIMLLELAFIVPLGAQPNQCYNDITPNDMKSEMTCAWSGALILFGGWAIILWSFIRTLSLHLQVCWDVVPGKKFFIITLILGWIMPPIALAVALVLTGTSYRFGTICHINHDKGLQVFWGPLMAFAGASLVIHFGTIVYCIHVYIKSVLDDRPTTDASSRRPSYTSSVHTRSARQTLRRAKHIIQLQWRGIGLVFAVLGNVIFFTVVFLSLDNAARKSPENLRKAQPWILCLAANKGDRNECVSAAADMGPNEATIMAVLILIALSGLWSIIFLGRGSMVTGWINYFKKKVVPQKEFISWDARDEGTQSRTYEMLVASRQTSQKSPDPLLRKSDMSTYTLPGSKTSSYHHTEDVNQPQRILSFSRPRPLNLALGPHPTARDWDPQSTFARGGTAGTPWYGQIPQDRPT